MTDLSREWLEQKRHGLTSVRLLHIEKKTIVFFLRGSEHMKGQPLRRFVTDAGQAFKFVYEFRYRFCVIKHIRLRPGYINPGLFNPPRAPPRRLLAFSSTLR